MDNISLDIFAETNIPENRRPFYKRMVGSTKENTEWNTSLSSFSVSVPQPWYFSIIHGAELRLNIDTETKIFYSFRPEPTSSLKMQIRNDDNLWDDVNIDDYLDRISISPIPKLSPILDLHVTLYKCLHEYAQQLRTSDIEIPSEDIIILDKTDYVSGTVSSSIDNNDFVKRISILTEDYNIQDKSTYLDGIQGGHLEYSSGLKKIPLLNKLKIMYDNFWSSTESLPDMKNLYTVVFGTDNVFGEYDTSVNLGGLDSKLEIHIRNDIKCKLRIRLHVFKMIKYIEGKIHIISGINAENYK